MTYDLNPHISILDDPATKRQVTELERAFDALARKEYPFSVEQMEREQFQAESNALAEMNPLYAAARVASVNFLVVPLDGTSPIVDPRAATKDAHLLFKWWQEWPEANPGILLGRVGGTLALRVEDLDAYLRLREMAAEKCYDVDNERSWTEYRDLGGYHVRLVPDSQPFSARMRTGWGKSFTRAVNELARQEQRQQPQTFFLVYSYPSVPSGMDAFDYRTRQIDAGIRLLGEGEVLAWNGAILEGGVYVSAPLSRPPEVPIWLAKTIGKPRSRKVMAAAREAYDAALRVNGIHPLAEAPAYREAALKAEA